MQNVDIKRRKFYNNPNMLRINGNPFSMETKKRRKERWHEKKHPYPGTTWKTG